MNKFMIAELKGFLLANNIEQVVANDNAVIFRKGGLSFLFQHSTDDPYYFRLSLPKVALAKNIANVDINDLEVQYKVMKITIVDGDVWIVAEQFVYCRENLSSLFTRLITLLEEVLKALKEKLQASTNVKDETE
ncbi:MAG: hypothetical protein IKY74_06030 [Alistipes sp.]|nr:hypothetical protein [Alistipes sp.]